MKSPAPRFWWPTMWSTAIATITVTVHHVFRLGPEFIVPGILLILIPTLVLVWMRAKASLIAAGIFGVLVALIFAWFGVVDGILDHVFKAIGLEHITLLPGGEADIVDTFYSIGTVSQSAAIYEVTGLIEAAASIVMLGFTVALLVSQVAVSRINKAQLA